MAAQMFFGYIKHMLEITPTIFLDEKELTYEFIRASGPGGQNVNKVATAVQLRFNVTNSLSLLPEVKERLVRLAGSRITSGGILVIEAKRYRMQDQNRVDAQARLVALIQKAAIQPKDRRPTRPGASARAKRVDLKKRRGTIKKLRQSAPAHDD
jgi:ribosome-associated protein